MKKKYQILSLLALLVSGCNIQFEYDSISLTSTDVTSISGVESVDVHNSSIVADGTRTIDFYAINDFHGSVSEQSSEPGILKLGNFLYEKKQNDDAILINSGDMWQGSVESNYNRGALLTDCMNEIGFDCFTIGNHEFDWGRKYIQENRERVSESGYSTPFLAANIYDYDINTKVTGDYANLGEKYTIRELDNGLKVGIIGVIGSSQITSITSTFVDELVFVDPAPVIKSLSDELRSEQDVDVVVVSAHTDQGSLLNSSDSTFTDNVGITSISPITNKRYVDAVFCAHTHTEEIGMINGVPFIQGQANGTQVGTMSLQVSESGDVSVSKSQSFLTASSLKSTITNPKLEEIISHYQSEFEVVANTHLGTFDGSFYSSGTLPNLVAEAIANAALDGGFDIDYAIVNNARSTIYSGDVTYGDLYRALPFDNEVFIIKTKGYNIRNRLNNGCYMYRLDKTPLNDSNEYTIAVLDYLALHRNKYRNYDYFSDLQMVGSITKEGTDLYHYRDITADYIKSKGTLNYRNYTTNYNDPFNGDLLNQTI